MVSCLLKGKENVGELTISKKGVARAVVQVFIAMGLAIFVLWRPKVGNMFSRFCFLFSTQFRPVCPAISFGLWPCAHTRLGSVARDCHIYPPMPTHHLLSPQRPFFVVVVAGVLFCFWWWLY